jgi:hypothetical protein
MAPGMELVRKKYTRRQLKPESSRVKDLAQNSNLRLADDFGDGSFLQQDSQST